MELADALTITLLGMGVVFTGLLLTAALIVLFAVVPRLIRGRTGAASSRAPQPTASPSGALIEPAVMAVIVTVLEAERRLYRAGRRERLTISRNRGGSRS